MSGTYNISNITKLQQILKFVFGIVPIVAGTDKFLNLLTQWDSYVHPFISGILPFSASVLMMLVGVIEIAAGIIVLTKTKIGAIIVSAWLLVIALSLLFTGTYIDVAVRDIVMAISSYVLYELTKINELSGEMA